MFSIKKRLFNYINNSCFNITKYYFSFENKNRVKYFLNYFIADEFGHRANIKNGDLGYGWIHYSLIKVIKPKRVLCIGSRYGFIPGVLAQACKENGIGFVDFVDPGYGAENKNHWTGVGYWKTDKGFQSFNKFGLKSWIKIHLETSINFSKKTKNMYDYIYIDGNHSYSGVFLDYKLFWPKLKKNGFMLFHDVCVKGLKPEGKYGVNRFWKEIKSKKKSIIFPFKGSGLGIIQKT